MDLQLEIRADRYIFVYIYIILTSFTCSCEILTRVLCINKIIQKKIKIATPILPR